MSASASSLNSSPEAPAAATGRVLVLGLGNDILTDDAVGLEVARHLRSQLAGVSSVEVCETTEMGLALLDFMTGYSAVVIVDSIQTGGAAPGSLHRLDGADLEQLTGRTPHVRGVSETLALGRQLGLAMPAKVTIFAIEVEDPFTLGTNLSPSLRAALPGIVGRISAAVRALA